MWGEAGKKRSSGRSAGETYRRRARKLFLGVIVLIELVGLTKTENLTAGMAGQNAVRSLRFERYHCHVPGTSTIRRRHAPARQPLERLELEDSCRRGPSVVQRTRRN